MPPPPEFNVPLSERLAEIRRRMESAAARSGRNPDEITLIAVTKTHPASTLEQLRGHGLVDFGENRVQEFLQKHQSMGGSVRWHFIGHLQRNKAAQVVGRAEIIHSVDSLKLVDELEKRAAAKGIIQRILIEINIGEDPNKTSAAPGDLPKIVEALAHTPHLRAEGLMTIPPQSDNPEASRLHFRNLRELMRRLPSCPQFRPIHLSMGMSDDFEVAIEEGATMVRIGSALLGERFG